MRQGQSLIEVLMAVGIGVIVVLGVVAAISPALRGSSDNQKAEVGTGLGKELLDNVKVMSEASWHNLDTLSTSSLHVYYLNTGKSPFLAVIGTEGVVTGPVNSLVDYWKMDEGSGSYAYDYGPNQATSTLYNDVSWTSGKIDGGLFFGGSTAQLIAANTAGLRYTGGNMSISMWINPDPTDDGGFLISKPWNGGGQYNYTLTISGGANPTLNFSLSGATAASLNSVKTISAGSWHNVVVTLDQSSNVIMYIDGAIVNQGVNGISSWTPGGGDLNLNLVMGCVYPYGSSNCAGATTYDYKGTMDEVRIYNRTISAAEVKDLYNGYSFTRDFYVDDTYRNSSGQIMSSPGTLYDPSTKKITVEYSWPGGATNTLARYVTRSRNFYFSQSDWTGGSGATVATSVISNKFDTSSNLNSTSVPGTLFLPLP